MKCPSERSQRANNRTNNNKKVLVPLSVVEEPKRETTNNNKNGLVTLSVVEEDHHTNKIMLDTQTKKRIDDCRDILVGKLPDPKAQIEQITIGLIYKFMDDMDKEAIELGGSAKFFSADYEKFAWDKLFDSKVTAAEMLRLYSEAIESMEKNPNIPQLFRDIFNNAYLPYRDPETLKMFLKTIGEFEYTHSEKLGDAFEYLLSVMGSQGDAGQFRTPRHIIDFLVAIVDPQKTDTILDPACGTAGFLISAYKHILLKHTKANKEALNIYEYNKLEKKPFNNLGDQLTPDNRKKLIQDFAGYDISPDMVRLSLVNLYLHGFSDPDINEYDTLSSEERWNESFDVVLANPPFMSPKGGIRPHKKFTIASNRSEVLFVDYIAEHLNPKGKAGIIVPEGVIFQSGKAYKDLRKMLVENYLYAVVSLPAGVFNPYSGVKTSILLMDKAIAKQRKEILFVKIDNDGYNLGAQRNAVKGSQLEEAIANIQKFRRGENVSSSGDKGDSSSRREAVSSSRRENVSSSVGENVSSSRRENVSSSVGENVSSSGVENAHAVLKTEIAANGDYNLSGERYRIITNIESAYPLIKLSEVVDLVRGITFGKKDQLQEPNNYSIKVATTKAAQEGGIVNNALYNVPRSFLKSNEKLLMDGDILMSTANSLNLLGRVTYVDKLKDEITFGAFMTLLRPKKNRVHPKLIYQLLKSELAKDYYFANANTTTNISNLKFEDLNNLQIPLPPLSIQEEIVAEIEGYQKIIDGAKAVVSNYKPKIDIDPDWEMVELGEVFEIKAGGTPLRSTKEFWAGDIPWYSSGELNETYTEDPKEYITKEGLKGSNATLFPKGSLLIGMYDTAAFKMSILNRDATFNQAVCGVKPVDGIDLYFLMLFLNMNKEEYLRHRVGVRQRNLNKGFISKIHIPRITIETQHQIVAQIEKEQALVNANKQLIEIFEQKIKARIAKVWGE